MNSITIGTGNGLIGEYYDNKNFTNLKLTRTDSLLNFDWGKGSPDSAIGVDKFSTRWTGQIQPLYSETYNFYTTADDGVRLWVDGKLIVDTFHGRKSSPDDATIKLEAGKKYDIRLDYYENNGKANASLSWSSASQKREIVPQSQLYSKSTNNKVNNDSSTAVDNTNNTEIVDNNNTSSDTISKVTPIQNSDPLKTVKIGGGGFVTGIVIHPQAADVMYARTDVGGLYRWDAGDQDWHQLITANSVGQEVSASIESVAVDPNDPNVVYAATGSRTHTGKGEEIPGNILKSVDGGNTWQVLDISIPMGGNGEWRWAGERLAVDPNNSNIVYFGSRLDGLWQSKNGGESWNQVDTSSIPVGKSWGETKDLAGVTFVKFDESSQGNGKSKEIYVGVAGKGVYHTTDGGNNWQLLASQWSDSLVPQQAEINAEGELVVTLYDPQDKSSNGGVWKFDGTWSDVTPKNGNNYAGLTADPSNPDTLFAVTYPMTPEDIYRSTDGGDTWTALNSQNQGLDWYPSWNFWTLSGDLAVSPTDSNQLWLTNGFGIWQTDDAKANTVNWKTAIDGVEETVPFDAVSTPGGANLITAIADFDGFRHSDISATPTKSHSNGEFSTTTSIDYSSSNPNFVVRVGGSQNDYSKRQAGFSTDNGITWQNFASIKNGTHPGDLNFGNVAVSATNTNNIVWQGTDWAVPYYTKDKGKTWNKIDFFDRFGGGAHTHLWNRQQALAADSVAGNTFYVYHHTGGQLVRTQDGGKNWKVANQDDLLPSGVWSGANVKTLPGVAGEVWVSLDHKGLYRSSDSGESFTQITGVEDADAFGFGKPAPNSDTPTLFVSGEIDGKTGVFGSTNLGSSWTQVQDLPDAFLGEVQSITGDMNDFGRVYVGVGGHGFVYGDLD